MHPVLRAAYPILAQRDACVARYADPDDMPDIFALRGLAFRGDPLALDRDRFDDHCSHLWIGQPGEPPLATVRLRVHRTAQSLLESYTAQYYDLVHLAIQGDVTLELGRLCTRPGVQSRDVIRLVWASIAHIIDDLGAARLIGCTSFRTTDPSTIRAALSLLARDHLAPGWSPAILRGESLAFRTFAEVPASQAEGLAQMPSLLRCYLRLGGWVSEHLVIDRDLGTSHVFTCVDVGRMPSKRRAALAGQREGR